MFCFTWSNIGASCCLSLLCCVMSAATMICASLSGAAFVRPVGDPAVRVREVPLGLWFRHRLLGIGNLRWASRSLPTGQPPSGAVRRFGLPRPPWPPRPSAGLRLPVPPSLPDLLQPAFPPGQLVGELVGLSLPFLLILGRIRRFGLPQQLFHFRLQLLLGFIHPSIAHRLVLARVPLHLAPVHRDMSQFHQPRLLAQSQRLHEQARQRSQMPLPKFAHRAVVRMGIRTQVPKRHILVSICRELTTPVLAINQQPHHHHRMVRRLPTPVLLPVDAIAPGDSPVASRVTTAACFGPDHR